MAGSSRSARPIATPARATSFGPSAAHWFALAVDKVDRAVALDNTTPDLARAQALASAVLGLLNAQPLSAAKTGGLRTRRAGRRTARPPWRPTWPAGPCWATPRAGRHLCAGGLLDVVAVENLLADLDDDDDYVKDERPGTVPGEESTERAAAAISKHVALMRLAYPDAVRRSAFADADSLMYLLAQTKLALSKRAAVEIAVNAGHDGAAAGTAYDNQAGKNKRRADDDANPAPKKKSKASYDDDASFELDDSD